MGFRCKPWGKWPRSRSSKCCSIPTYTVCLTPSPWAEHFTRPALALANTKTSGLEALKSNPSGPKLGDMSTGRTIEATKQGPRAWAHQNSRLIAHPALLAYGVSAAPGTTTCWRLGVSAAEHGRWSRCPSQRVRFRL
jgi:hypothetical protein